MIAQDRTYKDNLREQASKAIRRFEKMKRAQLAREIEIQQQLIRHHEKKQISVAKKDRKGKQKAEFEISELLKEKKASKRLK